MEDNILQEIKNLKHASLPKKSDEEIKKLAKIKLGEMNLQEKIGQLFQSSPPTADVEGLKWNKADKTAELIKKGMVGSILSVSNPIQIYNMQVTATKESRLGIPLFFGTDFIHGCRTGFPINLAMASSFDPELIEEVAKVVAFEASRTGITMTYSPMVDLVRDPRWGRVMESNGEDPYLNSEIAQAYVRGYQQNNLSGSDTVAACGKHFAAYGAAEAGREYNTVDMSDRHLRQFYLPGYKACAEEGVAAFMTAFNIINGVPATANKYLLRDILRDEWKYDGFVISDYTSSYEMLDHKTCKDEKDVALQSIKAGLDHEMVSMTYIDYLEELVKENQVDEKLIDEACLRLLEFKYKVGLFDNPFKNIYPDREKYMVQESSRKLARKVAQKSVVLLKNENKVLPLKKANNKIAIIGPLAESKDVVGAWGGLAKNEECVSLAEGIVNKVGKENVLIAKGCDYKEEDRAGFAEAIEIAKKADVIVLAMGEHQWMTGESSSRAFLNIPGVQNELIAEIKKLGKPTTLVLFTGRPLELKWHDDNLDSILLAWFLGNESGNAIADILFGDENPSGKLAMSFPVTVGQCPVYYNQYETGRPVLADGSKTYRSCFIDIPNEPLYPFGFGLSFSKFEYTNSVFDKNKIKSDEKLKIKVSVKNNSNIKGEEIVQLYIECKYFSVTRPLKELKKFKKLEFMPFEEKIIEFELNENDLAFYNKDMKFTPENTDYIVYIGGNSRDNISKEFSYEV